VGWTGLVYRVFPASRACTPTVRDCLPSLQIDKYGKLASLILVRLVDLLLFLQDGAGGTSPTGVPTGNTTTEAVKQGPNFVEMLPLMAAAGIMFYLMVLRPNQRQRKEQEEKLNALKKHDKVVTAGGIIGTITDLSNDGRRVTLRVDDGTRIKFTRLSIQGLYDDKDKPENKDKPDAESEEKK